MSEKEIKKTYNDGKDSDFNDLSCSGCLFSFGLFILIIVFIGLLAHLFILSRSFSNNVFIHITELFIFIIVVSIIVARSYFREKKLNLPSFDFNLNSELKKPPELDNKDFVFEIEAKENKSNNSYKGCLFSIVLVFIDINLIGLIIYLLIVIKKSVAFSLFLLMPVTWAVVKITIIIYRIYIPEKKLKFSPINEELNSELKKDPVSDEKEKPQ